MNISVRSNSIENLDPKAKNAVLTAIARIASTAKTPKSSILKGIKKDIKQNIDLKESSTKKLNKIKEEMEKLKQSANKLQIKNVYTLDKLKSKILKKT